MVAAEDSRKLRAVVARHSMDVPFVSVLLALRRDTILDRNPGRYLGRDAHKHCLVVGVWKVTAELEQQRNGWNWDKFRPASCRHAQGVQAFLLHDLCERSEFFQGRLA